MTTFHIIIYYCPSIDMHAAAACIAEQRNLFKYLSKRDDLSNAMKCDFRGDRPRHAKFYNINILTPPIACLNDVSLPSFCFSNSISYFVHRQ